jgi:hypothetical protein
MYPSEHTQTDNLEGSTHPESQFGDHDAHANSQTTASTTTTTNVNPFAQYLMMAQFHPLYYWPYPHPMLNPFAQFPVPYFLCPVPVAAWYHFSQQQSMMTTPVSVQPAHPFGIRSSITPQNPIAQTTDMGPVTSITNIVFTGNEIGNDNSTNLEIHKNSMLSPCSLFYEPALTNVAIGHHSNTGSG